IPLASLSMCFQMQAVDRQLCYDGLSFDWPISNNSDPALNIDNRGRLPPWSRPAINDQIKHFSKTILDFFSCSGRWHTFTIRTSTGHWPDSTQEIDQRGPRTEADADRASSRSHRMGESRRRRKDNGERSWPECIHQCLCGSWNGPNERGQLVSFPDQHENRFALRPVLDRPQPGKCPLIEGSCCKAVETFRWKSDQTAVFENATNHTGQHRNGGPRIALDPCHGRK